MRADFGNGSRFAARPVAAGGTPVADWTGWQREFPNLSLDECPGLLLVSPHPDDETLGFGATVAMLRVRGVPVQLVSVTDGGGAYPGISPLERRWLERDRRTELRRAAELLGLAEPIHLGWPDGEIAVREQELTDVLVEMLGATGEPPWCASTWSGDGHPDHEAAGRAAVRAAQRAGTAALEYPIWMWHWAVPDDPDVPWHRARRVQLDRSAIVRKQHATKVFRTQLQAYEPGFEPVVPPFAVQRLQGVGEIVFA
jgi:LmbE family N-acetylglucosaminyl deacetylase